MQSAVLFVDDEINILSSIRRQLKGKFDLHTAGSGQDALDMITRGQHFAVVISDYKMPSMDGVQFLTKVREISKDTVRIMLTGQADMDAIIDVINKGDIFRFLTKPCPPDLLAKNINDALEHYRLVRAEKTLLSKTLAGSLQVLTDILVLAKPQAFNRSIRIKDIVKKILPHLQIKNTWLLEVSAMLSQIGCVTVPDNILNKVLNNEELDYEESIIYKLHTKTSSDIIKKIPRLEQVAEIILYHEKYYNGTGLPNDDVKGEELPFGSRLLRIVLDFDQLVQQDSDSNEAFEIMKNRDGFYDTRLLITVQSVLKNNSGSKQFVTRQVKIDELNENMYLAREIVSASGVIVGSYKQRVTSTLIVTLSNYCKNREIKEPIAIMQYTD